MKERSNFYVYFGIWVAILPFIGVPGVWKTYLICLSGLIIVFYALLPSILKKLQAKNPRPRKKLVRPTDTASPVNDLRFNEPTQPPVQEPLPNDGDE